MTLIEAFLTVKDPRRAEGCRTSLEQIFSMVIISYLCGYTGYRPVATFSKSYEDLFTEELGLKHPVPSYVTFRDVLMRTNEKELINAFNNWASSYVPVEPGDCVSGDGKSLRSTLVSYDNNDQDFQSVVSLFCQNSGLVAKIATFRNKKKSEIDVALEVLNLLKTSNLFIRLDALHTQKKQ
jgi:hypothetical protein